MRIYRIENVPLYYQQSANEGKEQPTSNNPNRQKLVLRGQNISGCKRFTIFQNLPGNVCHAGNVVSQIACRYD
jgi:hypothetical protein